MWMNVFISRSVNCYRLHFPLMEFRASDALQQLHTATVNLRNNYLPFPVLVWKQHFIPGKWTSFNLFHLWGGWYWTFGVGRVASRAECHSTQIACWSRSRLIQSFAFCETWQILKFEGFLLFKWCKCNNFCLVKRIVFWKQDVLLRRHHTGPLYYFLSLAG